jgi:sulfur-oxidizing protein SoxY
MRRLLLIVNLLFVMTTAHANDFIPRTFVKDPFDSRVFPYHQVTILSDPSEIQWDDRVKVILPAMAEDATQVPVFVDATAIEDVSEMIVFADYAPIPLVLKASFDGMKPSIGFRIKVEQATVVRAVVVDKQGQHFVGGSYINALGGGCTTPDGGTAKADWVERLGRIQYRFSRTGHRLRVGIDHPMDTGLAPGIPAYYIEQLKVSGRGYSSTVSLYEPISENPVFTFAIPEDGREPVAMTARDTGGDWFDAILER